MLAGLVGFYASGIYKWLALVIGVIFGYQIFSTVLILFAHKQEELTRQKSALVKWYTALSGIWLVGWSLYVALWIVGAEGLHIVANKNQFWCMVVLDFFCKDVTEIIMCCIKFKLQLSGKKKIA